MRALQPASTAAHLSVTTSGSCGLLVVSVEGEIDMTTAPKFNSALASAIDAQAESLILDLSEVLFMGSAGAVSVLELAHERKWTPFAVIASSAAVRRPLTLLGVSRSIVLYNTMDQAMAAVQPYPEAGVFTLVG